MRTSISISALLGLASLVVALPKDGLNYELYTNSLGYTASRFKPGMEPGSDDYARRFGAGANNITLDLTSGDGQLTKRAENRNTDPFMGRKQIAYGCDTDIPGTVFDKLHTLCQDTHCDEGIEETIETSYPTYGRKESATITIKAAGNYPSGMKHAFIWAVQAMAMPEAVEWKWIETNVDALGHTPARAAGCDVSYSSNFFSVVMRGDDGSQMGEMNVEVDFKVDGEDALCDLVFPLGEAIAGAIHGIAGGIFGVVSTLACS
ncbi:uncharacterized protein RCC_07888 [Ramularia collo-cygni]|uniref:Uncharacterized protein n=1 Tax=Ramularia collo-cygni TaxID=112498 RepID=A0A2D3VIY9_9PEZI|nr:uncharacterized protein RCC_07888 [Ramularia collo-cygni]CZT22019.1 uncharacterized protein RCC_07888 [Ramularia collo-cygni]